jgi:hypothetical protein
MKKSLNNSTFIYSLVFFLFYIGIMLLFTINFYEDFILPKEKSFMWCWYHTGEFKYQNGLFLDFFMVGGMILLLHLKPELLELDFKKIIMTQIKKIKKR